MYNVSVVRWLVIIILIHTLLTCDEVKADGFSDYVPPGPHRTIYGAYYLDYTNARLGTLYAGLLPNGSIDLYGSSSAYDRDAIIAHVLIPFPSNHCDDTANATALLSTSLGKIDPHVVSDNRGIGLVLLFRPAQPVAAVPAPRAPQEDRLNVSCVLTAVEAYNARGEKPRVTAVAFTNNPQRYRFTPSDTLRLPRELYRVYDFSLLVFSAQEWKEVEQAAMFNHARWARGYAFPHYILETRSGLHLAEFIPKSPVSNTSVRPPTSGPQQKEDEGDSHNAPNCLAAPRPSCAPLGGWTVWATDAETRWEWMGSPINGFAKHTTHGAAALFIPSTSPTLVHGAAPGANEPASAIVTALAILDAAGRHARHAVQKQMEKPREVYAFFFPGEHNGGVGSARFITDAMGLNCTSLEDCTGLAYGTELNFTTVNISAMSTFIALDQLAQVDAPLYYHVDARGPSGAAQCAAESQLNDFGLRRAATAQLPYSPITTLLDHTRTMPMMNGNAEERVMLTFARYNTSYVDPFVFTMLDTAKRVPRLHPMALAEAANAVLRVLYPHKNVTANVTLIDELWNCLAAGEACEKILQRGSNGIDTSPGNLDYTFGAFAPITSAQSAIEGALQYIGWNPLRAPAVPRALRVPSGQWYRTAWSLDERWIREHHDTRYATVMVESILDEGRGARSAMISSVVSNYMFLLGSCTVGVLVLVAARACVVL